MVILPLVERELHAATRRPRTYWVRVVAAVLAVGVGSVALLGVSNWRAGSIAGGDLFRVISTLAFLLCLFAGVFTTSLCLSEERRLGTLELLVLTDLGPLSVVLGKLSAVSLNSMQTLLGAMPVLADRFHRHGCCAWVRLKCRRNAFARRIRAELRRGHFISFRPSCIPRPWPPDDLPAAAGMYPAKMVSTDARNQNKSRRGRRLGHLFRTGYWPCCLSAVALVRRVSGLSMPRALNPRGAGNDRKR